MENDVESIVLESKDEEQVIYYMSEKEAEEVRATLSMAIEVLSKLKEKFDA